MAIKYNDLYMDLRRRLREAGARIGVQVTLQREDVFQMMYKI